MKKLLPIQQSDNQLIYRNNRNRLIEQNRKLYSEIIHLESHLSTSLTKSIANDFLKRVQTQKFQQEHKDLTQNQISLMKKLKRKLLLKKNAERPQEKQDIRQSLDQLAYLRKEKYKYELQKEALLKKKIFKEQGLELDIPIEEQQKKMIFLYKAAQRQNFKIMNKSLKIERQINNLHKIKELAKTSVPKQLENSSMEIKKIQQEILRFRQETKKIDKKWQPFVDSLDTEYFVLKQINEGKQKQIDVLRKILNTLKNRVLAMKQEAQILKDRARLSQVVISQQKRQEIFEIYKSQKQRRQFFEQFRSKSNVQSFKSSRSKVKIKYKKQVKSPRKQLATTESSKAELIKISQTEINPTKIKFMKREIDRNSLEFNEFQVQSSPLQQNPQTNPMIQLTSVGVGTTFYYKEKEQSVNLLFNQ